MPTPIRFRRDSMSAAEEARDRAAGKPASEWGEENEVEVARTPPVAVGDCWRIVYSATEDGKPESTAGYAICCPKCGQLHYWCSANNCSSKRRIEGAWVGRGPRRRRLLLGWTCDHIEARTSCWTWTVDETGKPIKAVASLFVNHPGGCGYHGHLGSVTPGVLTDG